jgi:hypothetical protein
MGIKLCIKCGIPVGPVGKLQIPMSKLHKVAFFRSHGISLKSVYNSRQFNISEVVCKVIIEGGTILCEGETRDRDRHIENIRVLVANTIEKTGIGRLVGQVIHGFVKGNVLSHLDSLGDGVIV